MIKSCSKLKWKFLSSEISITLNLTNSSEARIQVTNFSGFLPATTQLMNEVRGNFYLNFGEIESIEEPRCCPKCFTFFLLFFFFFWTRNKSLLRKLYETNAQSTLGNNKHKAVDQEVHLDISTILTPPSSYNYIILIT